MEKTIAEIIQQLEENEKYYRNEKPLRLESPLNIHENLTWDTFLEKLILDYNRQYYTVYVNEPSVKQCEYMKNRTTRDLFIITSYYFPEINIVDFIMKLQELNHNKVLDTIHCRNINMRIWRQFVGGTWAEEYDRNDGNAIHGFDVYTDNINFKDIKKLYEHINKEEQVTV